MLFSSVSSEPGGLGREPVLESAMIPAPAFCRYFTKFDKTILVLSF